MDPIDRLLRRLARQPFRARFHLEGAELERAVRHGPQLLRRHALEIVAARLAPAAPRNDGRQTPYRGHPVFVAQHATATCCRRCLQQWHGIPAGAQLREEQQRYVADVIGRWIGAEVAGAAPGRPAARAPGHRR